MRKRGPTTMNDRTGDQARPGKPVRPAISNSKLGAMAGMGIGGVMVAALWTVGADPLTLGIVAAGTAAVFGVARWLGPDAPGSSSQPSSTDSRRLAAAPAEGRLPAGVADERLLDRLAIHEMTRARRYEHPLTLLLVDIDNWSALNVERGKRSACEQFTALAIRIRRLLRDVDAIGLHGDGQLAILLPETPLDGALVVAGRIAEAAREDVGLAVRVGAAVFPDDSVSVDGLLQEAEAAVELARLEGLAVAQRVLLT